MWQLNICVPWAMGHLELGADRRPGWRCWPGPVLAWADSAAPCCGSWPRLWGAGATEPGTSTCQGSESPKMNDATCLKKKKWLRWGCSVIRTRKPWLELFHGLHGLYVDVNSLLTLHALWVPLLMPARSVSAQVATCQLLRKPTGWKPTINPVVAEVF